MPDTERSIKVRLTAEARSLKEELAASTAALKALKESGESTDRELKELQARADKAGVSLLKLAADGKISGEALRSAGRDVQGMNRDLADLGSTRPNGARGAIATLRAEIEGARAKMEEARAEFKRTGSAESLAGFKAAEAEVKKLDGLLEDVAHVAGVEGEKAGKSLAGGMQRGMSESGGGWKLFLSPQGAALGVALVAAATPVIATGIGAAVGAGLLAGAAAVHKDDPLLVAALGGLKETTIGVLKDASAPLTVQFAGALLDLQGLVQREKPALARAFQALVPAVQPLEKAVEGFVDPIVQELPHLADTMAKVAADPRTQHAFEDMGNAVGDVVDTIADNKETIVGTFELAAHAVDGVTFAFSGLLSTVNAVQQGYSKLTGWLTDPNNLLRDPGAVANNKPNNVQMIRMTDLGMQQLAQSTEHVSQSTQNATDVSKDYTDALDDLRRSQDDAYRSTMNLSQATGDWEHGLAHLKDQLDLHDRKLNESTDAGHQNADALRGLVQEAENVRDAEIASGKPIDEANAKFNAQIHALEQQAIKAGLSAKAVHNLIDQYLALYKMPNISKSVHIGYTVSGGVGKPIPDALGGVHIPAAASGLVAGVYPASSPPLIRFAEPQTGGEVLDPRLGIPHSRGLALADVAARWHGGHVVAGDGASIGADTVTVQNHVYLDGQPFYAYTANAQREAAWRSRRR